MTEQLQFPTGSRTVHHAKLTSVIHLDEHTREVGRAGVAEARAILAACAPPVLGKGTELSGRHDPLGTVVEAAPDGRRNENQDGNLDQEPMDDTNTELPAAA